MQEQDGLETALQKAIFSRKEEQQYMPVLHENHIHKDTEFFMIQCYFPANKDIQADDKFDNTSSSTALSGSASKYLLRKRYSPSFFSEICISHS